MIQSNDTPMISIITATRNRAHLLGNALRSMQEQSLISFESIVVDDGSDAISQEAYKALYAELNDRRFILDLRSTPGNHSAGPAVTRNRGIRLARRKFIAFCDDDDQWRMNDHLSFAVEMLQRHNADMLFSNMRGEHNRQITVHDWFPKASKDLHSGLRLSNKPVLHEISLTAFMGVMKHHLPHLNGCVMRRQLLDDINLFWESAPFQEDLDLVIRAADASKRILYRPDCVARFNTAPRGSWAMSIASVDRSLAAVLVAGHVIATCRHDVTRHRARGIESWHRRIIARHLLERRERSTAAAMAWSAWTNHPTWGSASSLFATAFGSVFLRPKSKQVRPQPASAAPIIPQ
jgi:glycosyltransferase involved in cell wall biosynthesis